MNTEKSIEILEALVSGCSPATGEILATDSVLNERDVIRALQVAINELKPKARHAQNGEPKKERNPYSEIDFFRRDKFNNLTDKMVEELQMKVDQLGIVKSENLPEYMAKARLNYPRAYEPWTEAEKKLFENAIAFTNDLDLLSECFQRGKGSIQSFGQKCLFENQNTEKNQG